MCVWNHHLEYLWPFNSFDLSTSSLGALASTTFRLNFRSLHLVHQDLPARRKSFAILPMFGIWIFQLMQFHYFIKERVKQPFSNEYPMMGSEFSQRFFIATPQIPVVFYHFGWVKFADSRHVAICCPHFPGLPDSLWQRGMVLLMASAPVVWHSICLGASRSPTTPP